MTKAAEYRAQLRALNYWDPYLLRESGLPGPRGNIELAQVVADEGDLQLFQRYIAFTPNEAPTNSPYEFLAFCGIVGLGRLLAEGDLSLFDSLRRYASDSRWRIREAVAMALQRLGETDMERLLAEMQNWSHGTPLEQRAAAAGLCEPRLLGQAKHAREVQQLSDGITAVIERADNRGSQEFKVLRKGLGFCWSVAVAALPAEGKAILEKWLASPNKDVQWIVKENLKKARLRRMDADWVQEWLNRTSKWSVGSE